MSDSEPEKTVAIALHYEHGGVPKVTAKGEGELADRIIETAREAGVAIESNPLLAEALSSIDLDEEIPENLYRAVAEILGFVLRMAERKKSGSSG